MLYELQDNLGLLDARKCNKEFGASLPLDSKEIAKGSVIDLPPTAAGYLGSKYKALLKPASKVKGDAKDSELKTVAAK
jgi:hypothetical protein